MLPLLELRISALLLSYFQISLLYPAKTSQNKHCRNTVKQNNGSITPYISLSILLWNHSGKALLGKTVNIKIAKAIIHTFLKNMSDARSFVGLLDTIL